MATTPTTVHQYVQQLTQRFVEQPSGELRRMCEMAVFDAVTPARVAFSNGEVSHSVTMQQANEAVAAVLAVLALHEKLPNEAVRW